MKIILYVIIIISIVGCGSNSSASRNKVGAVENKFNIQRNNSRTDIKCDSLTNIRDFHDETNPSNKINEQQKNTDLNFQTRMSELKEMINDSNDKIEMERVNKMKAQKKIDEQNVKIRELMNSIDDTEDKLGVISNKSKN